MVTVDPGLWSRLLPLDQSCNNSLHDPAHLLPFSAVSSKRSHKIKIKLQLRVDAVLSPHHELTYAGKQVA